MVDTALPQRARVVVIGGGVIGTSVAYHLAHLGRGRRCCSSATGSPRGTTWHAAGLMVTFGSTSETSTEMRQVHPRPVRPARGRDRPGDRASSRSGFIEVAADADRLEEYRRVVGVQPAAAASTCTRSRRARSRELFPLARTDDVLAGFYVAEDGRANPVDVTMSLAKGARHGGRDGSSRACRSPDVLHRAAAR